MCGFLAGTIINPSVDAATGYATTEIGPRWRQRQPLPINRWHTLVIKWVMAAVLTGLMTGLLLVVAAGILRMDAPHLGLLWLLAWLCAASVAAGTIVVCAVLGASLGQLLALLLFVYAGLAAAGGTVPLQALPGVLRWLAQNRAATPDPRWHPGDLVLRRPGRRRAGASGHGRHAGAGHLADRGRGTGEMV